MNTNKSNATGKQNESFNCLGIAFKKYIIVA